MTGKSCATLAVGRLSRGPRPRLPRESGKLAESKSRERRNIRGAAVKAFEHEKLERHNEKALSPLHFHGFVVAVVASVLFSSSLPLSLRFSCSYRCWIL